jgi:hypothetical protein
MEIHISQICIPLFRDLTSSLFRPTYGDKCLADAKPCHEHQIYPAESPPSHLDITGAVLEDVHVVLPASVVMNGKVGMIDH